MIRPCLLLALLGALPALAQAPPADLDPQTTPTGLGYSVLQAGAQGPKPARTDRVRLRYAIWLDDGSPLQVMSEPIATTLGGLPFAGLVEGVGLMTAGARFKLVVPPKLGPLPRPRDLPRDAALVLEVELLEVRTAPVCPKGDPARQTTTPDGLVWEALAAGAGEPLAPADGVELAWACFSEQGVPIRSTHETGEVLRGDAKSARLSGGPAPTHPFPFFALLRPHLREGTRLRLVVPMELGFGRAVPGLALGARSVWLVEVERIARAPGFARTAPAALVTTPTGLGHEVLAKGEGPPARRRVTLHYAGWLADGTFLAGSYGRLEPTALEVGGELEGLGGLGEAIGEGLALVGAGGRVRLTIPARLEVPVEEGAGSRYPAGATIVVELDVRAIE